MRRGAAGEGGAARPAWHLGGEAGRHLTWRGAGMICASQSQACPDRNTPFHGRSRLHLSGPGQPSRGHGPRPGRRVRVGPRGVRRSRRDAQAEAVEADVRRSRRGTHADGEHPARADGALAGGVAHPGTRRRVQARRQGGAGRRAFPGRVQRAGRRRGVHRGGSRAPVAAARTGHAEGGSAWRRRDGRPAGRRNGARPRNLRRGRCRPGRARGGRARQRQRRRAGGDLRPSRGRRARDRDVPRQGRAPRHAAAGVRAVPLRADGAGRRRDGGSAGEHPARRPGRAGGGQRDRRQVDRPAGDPRPAGAAGDRRRCAGGRA